MAPLLEKVTDAVVNISVTATEKEARVLPFNDPRFRRFFGDGSPPDGPRKSRGAGSGVIVDAKNGYILTNHHVINDATEVVVTLKDRRRLRATVVGSDADTDIAVIEVDAQGLVEIEFAEPGRTRVGDVVFAIGNPFGLGQTVTSGIVSALGRGIGVHGYEDFIQTDAPINPGNSGGALVNSKGELAGINTAIIAPAGGNVGIGFAVSSKMAKAVMSQIVEHGEVRRGRIGVVIQDLTPAIAEAIDADAERGALIARVAPNSPAAKAGLQPGDIVVEAGGQPVSGASALKNHVGLLRPGERVDLSVRRGGEHLSTTLEVSDAADFAKSLVQEPIQLAGAELSNLPTGHPQSGAGVLVRKSERGTRAWRGGLRAGDVVTAVNRQPIESVTDIEGVLSRHQKVLALEVLRGADELLVIIS
jgi:Do/DeqQ family serine protease